MIEKQIIQKISFHLTLLRSFAFAKLTKHQTPEIPQSRTTTKSRISELQKAMTTIATRATLFNLTRRSFVSTTNIIMGVTKVRREE